MIFRLKKRKGQNVAEYAILIALVIGAVIAMQKFNQRALQGRLFGAVNWMTQNTSLGGVSATAQYEPYYSESAYTVARNANDLRTLKGDEGFDMFSNSDVQRTGNQTTTYDVGQGIGNGMRWEALP